MHSYTVKVRVVSNDPNLGATDVRVRVDRHSSAQSARTAAEREIREVYADERPRAVVAVDARRIGPTSGSRPRAGQRPFKPRGASV